jgi:glycosyltransferase involved in cell wall biosynthesis
LSPKKNPEMLMRAFAKLDLPRTKLVLIGPNESGYLEKLQSIRAELELESSIIFVGPLFGNEKISAMVDADIFVLPSTNENFGNVIAESIAAGTPVIITDRCGIAPFIRDRVGLVVSPNQHELEQAIVTLLSNTSLYKRFELACSDVAKEFSWDQPAASMEKLYKKVLTRRQ